MKETVTLTYEGHGQKQTISLTKTPISISDLLDWIVEAVPALGFPKFDRVEIEELEGNDETI